MSVEIKADIRHWLRELDKKYFFVMLGFAVMVYFPLISQRLVNTFDGLWNGSWFIGGFWELSIGRWLWCVADAVRFGVQTEPLNALLTLSMMVLGITLLRRLFVERDNALTYFAGMAAISGAAVGVQLSYRYMSPIFGLSFLFAVLAAYWVITTTHAGAAVGCGAVILALSLGLYQANLAVFCMILLAYLLRLLFQNAEPQKTGVHIAKSLVFDGWRVRGDQPVDFADEGSGGCRLRQRAAGRRAQQFVVPRRAQGRAGGASLR